jgi:integrase
MPRRRGKRGKGSITPRAGKFQAQWSRTVNGKRIRQSATFSLKSEAEWWLREASRGSAPDVDLTVAEYLERWLSGKRKLRDSTKALYRSHIETWINPALGNVSITALQPRHVEAFVSKLEQTPSRTGKPLAKSTIRGVLTTLRAALATGVRRRELPDNAAQGVEAPAFQPAPIVPMTHEEAVALIQATEGHWLQPLIRFLLGSSVRIGEALALNQGQVLDGYVRILESKTLVRAVPVSTDAMAALGEAIRQAPRRGKLEPVFFGVGGDRLRRDVVSHALPELLEKAGLQRRTAHGLRHGAATLMLSGGVSMRVVSEQLGHKSERMTRRYAHVIPDLQRQAVGVLDEAVKR